MTIKRFILLLLTLLVIVKTVFSLGSSFTQPQIQARLELYQVNLTLHVAQWQPEQQAEDTGVNLADLRVALVGENPYQAAQNKYEEALELARTTRSNLEEQLQQLSSNPIVKVSTTSLTSSQEESARLAQVPDISPQAQRIQAAIQQLDRFIAELQLKIGLLQAQRTQVDAALNTWQELVTQYGDSEVVNEIPRTAEVLIGLWGDERVLPNAEAQIQQNLEGWFEYNALSQLYRVQNRPEALQTLQATQQANTREALVKLALVSAIPALGGLLGFGLLVFLIAQRLLKGKDSILATNSSVGWETPWDWEVIWQVLIVGFFFIGQVLLPLLIGFSGLNPTDWSIRAKALYVLGSYLTMAVAGLLVLYFSLKPFFPLPRGWFRFQGTGRWVFWGVGGYLVAVPLVIFVSLINQQIWQGQGGSNPLLFLAVQAQDWVALLVFLVTASIAAPVFEEIFFRGFLLPSLTRYVPVWGTILISAAIFSVAHLSLAEVLPLATLGIVLGVVYTRSRSLFAPILLHALWNGGTLLSLFILGSGVD